MQTRATCQGPANAHRQISVFYPDGVARTQRPERKGLASIVHLHLEYLTTQKQLLLDPEENGFRIQKLNFEFALTTCHEVVHAINFAFKPSSSNPTPRGARSSGKSSSQNQLTRAERAAELGYFLGEQSLRRHLPPFRIRHPENPVFINRWPSFLVRDQEPQAERAGPAEDLVQIPAVDILHPQQPGSGVLGHGEA